MLELEVKTVVDVLGPLFLELCLFGGFVGDMYFVFVVFAKTDSLTVEAIVVGGGNIVNVSVTVGYSVIGAKVVRMLKVVGEVGGDVTIGNGVGRVDMLLWLFVDVMKLSTTRRSLFATMKSKSVLQIASEMIFFLIKSNIFTKPFTVYDATKTCQRFRV